MKVLVLGATGFIGLPVAQALVRAGYTVYGQTRSDSKRKQLISEEIIPVVGDPNAPGEWLDIIVGLDAVINTVGSNEDEKLARGLLEGIINVVKKRPANTPKLAFVHTSGTWIFGHDPVNTKTDVSAVSPPEMIKWWPEHEQKILSSKDFNGIIIRPAMLYGRQGSLFNPLFQKTAKTGKVAWFGIPGVRYSIIHTDDLADLYLKAVQKPTIAAGNAFIGAASATVSVEDLLTELVRVSGAKGSFEFIEATNEFEKAYSVTTLLRPFLGESLLGWRPVKQSLVDNLEVYYQAALSTV